MSAERDNRAGVNFVFADEDSQFRIGLRSALAHEGYTSIYDCSSITKLRDSFQTATPDLLLIDAEMEGDRAFEVISDIRHGELGKNPFVTIMVTLQAPDGDLVQKVIDSGVDDLLLKPVSTAALMTRIKTLAEERQRFVVTTDYIGPQRRANREQDDNEDGLKLDLIEVPNTLGAKARGEEVDEYELQKLIAEAKTEINEQRLQRNGPEIAALVADIVPAFEEDRVDDTIKAKIESLSKFAEDVSERLSNTGFVHVSDLCGVLSSISASLKSGAANEKGIALLTPLSNAIAVSFNPNPDSAKFADQVVTLVRQFIDKNAADFAREE